MTSTDQVERRRIAQVNLDRVQQPKPESNGIPRYRELTRPADQIPEVAREPHVHRGYRDFGRLTIYDCFKTLFTLHNETVDIWTHLIPGVGFIFYFAYILKDIPIIGNPTVYPLLCLAFGGVVKFLCSSSAHLFSFASLRSHQICFYFDYAGISIFAFTAGLSGYFYSGPSETSSFLLSSPVLYVGINTTLCLLNMLLCCVSRYKLRSIRFYARTSLYVIKWLYDNIPVVTRIFTCTSTADCNPIGIRYAVTQALFYSIAALTNALRIPERWFPGTFDFIGRGHHIMHVFVTLGYYYVVLQSYADMTGRAQVLTTLPQPTAYTTFGYLAVVVIGNAIIGVVCAQRWKDEDSKLFSLKKYEVVYESEGYSSKKSQ